MSQCNSNYIKKLPMVQKFIAFTIDGAINITIVDGAVQEVAPSLRRWYPMYFVSTVLMVIAALSPGPWSFPMFSMGILLIGFKQGTAAARRRRDGRYGRR